MIMLNAGIIGYGYWGPNLARNFSKHPRICLKRIVDLKEDRRQLASLAHPQTEISSMPHDVTRSPDIDVVVIAAPVHTHYELAYDALVHDKHVWIEKPMTTSSAEGEKLLELAQKKKKLVMVDHTFLFTGSVQAIKQLIDQKRLGDIYYYDSVRVNLGLFQQDVNVIWDLAPHDLSIMDYILDAKPQAISAVGKSHFATGLEDVAYLTVYYENNLLAHVHVNWLSPVKIRQTLIGGSQCMVVWNDLLPDESVKIYNRGVDIQTMESKYNWLASYRMGDMHVPVVPQKEALQAEVDYFVQCMESNCQPVNDAAAGTRIVRMLEASTESLKNNGIPIKL